MKNTSILLKSTISGLVGIVFYVLFFAFAVYKTNSSEVAFIFGLLCGIIIAVISYNNAIKRAIVTTATSIFFVVVLVFLVYASGALNDMVFIKYHSPTGDSPIGCLSSEAMILMEYYSGTSLFFLGLSLSLFVTVAGVLIIKKKYTV